MKRIRRTKGDVRICAPEYLKWMLSIERQTNHNIVLMMNDFFQGIVQRIPIEKPAKLLELAREDLQKEGLAIMEQLNRACEAEETWLCARMATKRLNKMDLGIMFYDNLFPYLRKRRKLEGLCRLEKHGARPVWLYDTEGIADLVKKGELDYKPKWH